jgi:hypothetical protein
MTSIPTNAAPSDPSATQILLGEMHHAHHGAVELLLEIIHDTQAEIARGVALLRIGHLAEGRAILESLVSRLIGYRSARPAPLIRRGGRWQDSPPSI